VVNKMNENNNKLPRWAATAQYLKERPRMRRYLVNRGFPCPLLKHGEWDGQTAVTVTDDHGDHDADGLAVCTLGPALGKQMRRMYIAGYWGEPRPSAPPFDYHRDIDRCGLEAHTPGGQVACLIEHCGYAVAEVAQ
jgi:hypothetical protein